MTLLPSAVANIGRVDELRLTHQGKVRDTYELPGYPHHRLVVASDRISIFDFVLNALVPNKGEVLTAMNVFWRKQLLDKLCPHDLAAMGSEIDQYLPGSLRGNANLQMRATVVRHYPMLPVEAVVRGYLTGSGLTAYQASGEVCGHKLDVGLKDGSRLWAPIFTPTTKAEVGHDEHITSLSVRNTWGPGPENFAIMLYDAMSDWCQQHGIILADTKLEFGQGRAKGTFVLADEIGTPDSSRFWRKEDWLAARETGITPLSFDKERVRSWGKSLGINKRQPEIPNDVGWVHAQTVPQTLLQETRIIYEQIFRQLTDMPLVDFQREIMKISC